MIGLGNGSFIIDCGGAPTSETKFKGCFMSKDGINYVALGNKSVSYRALNVIIGIRSINQCSLEITKLAWGSYECGVLLLTNKNITARATYGRFNITLSDTYPFTQTTSTSSPTTSRTHYSNNEISENFSSLEKGIFQSLVTLVFL